ncbi:four-carbon acid sugar kinase family protein [Rubellimicrobium roseum]|uniref:Four-carbon acid sugar kinase family protein n=1 Tax=Rubellimicrobium roseum TaxID=687525 RepID=A0A5C4N7V9_9RHOB|nr:four-carbon acid sugar kinase family protein [Rubellimicrobium roseum]TNC65034.1 four-carbon acid sugar kinase family protein [Rubellimicrobium roseum]
MSLPTGPLVAWLGDDFTGGAAVAETLAFAGLPAVMFLEPPTPAMLARFAGLRAIGIASTARAESPDWMDRHLPDLYAALVATGAPVIHYKACSTMDSAPHVGSLGRALEHGLASTGETCAPILFASPEMGRYQAFGQLFAAGPGGIHRIDRHPVMARHPVTPMSEADIARHLGAQTSLPLAALMRPDLGVESFDRLAAGGARGVAVDCTGPDDLALVGRIIWSRRFSLGSQGIESALIAHFRAQGSLPEEPPRPLPSPVNRIAVVSGSASVVTARQIAWAEERGWPVIRLDTPALFGPDGPAAIASATDVALAALDRGRNPIVAALRGPDDPALAATRAAIAATGLSPAQGEARIGEALGTILSALMDTCLSRALVAGGDTSGRVTRALGVLALEPLAWIAHGASLMRGTRAKDSIEIILKGGQMGPEDLFARALGARPDTGKEGEALSRSFATNLQGGDKDHEEHVP